MHSERLISYPVQVKEGPSYLMNNTILCTRIVVHLSNIKISNMMTIAAVVVVVVVEVLLYR